MNKRGSLRDIGFSLLVVVILLMSIFTLQGVNEKPEPTYGDIRQLLLQQKVSRVEVDGNKLTLELKPGTEYGSGPIVHNLPQLRFLSRGVQRHPCQPAGRRAPDL